MADQGTADRLAGGRYRLREALGRGGMGVVWRAEDETLKRSVAIKEIRLPSELDGSEQDSVKARVLREAQVAARLNHPGAVSVYDVLKEEGRAFIVMELVDAPTLADLIERQGPLPPERVAAIGLQVLSALEEAHRHGIVHRDVKPGNVMVPEGGHTRLADFGIASVKDDPRLTASGMILGSPAFMAPEQATDGETGPATDIWSLGATLYHAATGKQPFDRNGPIPTLTAVLHEDPDLSDVGPLEGAIGACLVKDPALRPSHMELRRMLEAVAGGTASVAPAVGMGMPSTLPSTQVDSEVPVSDDEVEFEEQEAWTVPADHTARPGAPWMWALGALLVLTVVAAVALNRPDEGTRGSAPTQEDAGSAGEDESGNDGDSAEGAGGTAGGDGDTNTDDGAAASGAPTGWTSYEDPAGGFSIAYPEGWRIVPAGAGQTDFRDPETGTYMRVAWTDQPGDDVVGRLREIAANFSSRHTGYEELGIQTADYRDYDAGAWDYTYASGRATLRATNLQFLTGGRGYALNFQTSADNWEDHQELFEAFKETFRPGA